MSIFGSIGHFVEDAVDLAGDAIDDVESGVEDVVGAATEVAKAVVSEIEAVVEAGVAVIADVGGHLVDALAAVTEAFADTVGSALESVLRELGPVGDFIIDAAHWVGHSIGAAVEAIAKGASDFAEWAIDELIPFAYSVLKLGAALVAAIYLLPEFIAGLLICTQVTRLFGEEYGTVLKAVAKGYARYDLIYRIRRIPHNGKYVVFSDLHRYRNDDLDIPHQQKVLRLYCGVLAYYWQEGYTVIENGDVEDYWLRRGASWEPAYDLGKNFIGAATDAAIETGLHGIGGYHLNQVISNPHNQPVYAQLRLFHDQQRYLRTMGNHDDVYRSTHMVEELQRYFPGLEVNDYIVIDSADGALAVIAHGHQTDAWNHGACAWLGRITTGLAASINEVLPDAWELGVPSSDATQFWNGTTSNELTEVSPLVGATIKQDSLDERALHDTYASAFDRGSRPSLVLGHTHVPRTDPWNPDHHNYFATYVNDGAVLFPSTLTAVEWDGTSASPAPILAGWRYSNNPAAVTRRLLVGDFNRLKSRPESEMTFTVPGW